MKKLLVLFIASTFAFASCSKDEIEDDLNHKEVKAEHLEGSSWTVKHVKIHKANLDGKTLTDAEKTALEGLIKFVDEKLVLQKDNKMHFEYGDTEYPGTWNPKTEKDQWLVEFESTPTPPFGLEGALEIKSGRLYFSIGGLDYEINGKHYVIEKIEFELVPHS